MTKELNSKILDAIRLIIENSDSDVSYHIDRHVDKTLFNKNKREVVSINIILIREINNVQSI